VSLTGWEAIKRRSSQRERKKTAAETNQKASCEKGTLWAKRKKNKKEQKKQ
jgi:hypothetical protein